MLWCNVEPTPGVSSSTTPLSSNTAGIRRLHPRQAEAVLRVPLFGHQRRSALQVRDIGPRSILRRAVEKLQAQAGGAAWDRKVASAVSGNTPIGSTGAPSKALSKRTLAPLELSQHGDLQPRGGQSRGERPSRPMCQVCAGERSPTQRSPAQSVGDRVG